MTVDDILGTMPTTPTNTSTRCGRCTRPASEKPRLAGARATDDCRAALVTVSLLSAEITSGVRGSFLLVASNTARAVERFEERRHPDVEREASGDPAEHRHFRAVELRDQRELGIVRQRSRPPPAGRSW